MPHERRQVTVPPDGGQALVSRRPIGKIGRLFGAESADRRQASEGYAREALKSLAIVTANGLEIWESSGDR